MNESGFWAKVNKTESCWLWTGAKVVSKTTRAEYLYGILVDESRQRWLAHRYSYKITHGRLRRKSLVLHSCDVGLCVKPSHLRDGTQKDNIREAAEKGHLSHRHYRGVRGAENTNSKLTEHQVLEIRRLREDDAALWTQKKLGLRFGVDRRTVQKIVARTRWTHL